MNEKIKPIEFVKNEEQTHRLTVNGADYDTNYNGKMETHNSANNKSSFFTIYETEEERDRHAFSTAEHFLPEGVTGQRTFFMPSVSQENSNCIPDAALYSWQAGIGKAFAKPIEQMECDKVREATRTTHVCSDLGLVRGRAYPDGTQIFTQLARRRLCGGRRWEMKGETYFIVRIQSCSGGDVVETDMIKLSEVDDLKFVKTFLGRYLEPIEERAYGKRALEYLQGFLMQFVDKLPLECLPEHAGWQPDGTFWEGGNYPLPDTQMSNLQLPDSYGRNENDLSDVLHKIIKHLDICDFEHRMAFLLGCSLINLLLGKKHSVKIKLPDIVLTGNFKDCYTIADGCLKVYCRADGPDLIDLSEMDATDLEEYLRILHDDYLVLITGHLKGKRKNMAEVLLATRQLHGCKLHVPLVNIQSWPADLVGMEGAVLVDVCGMCSTVQLQIVLKRLKRTLIGLFQASELSKVDIDFLSLTELYHMALQQIKEILLQAGANDVIASRFVQRLRGGAGVLRNYNSPQYNLLAETFSQRFRYFCQWQKVKVIPYPYDVQAEKKEDVIMIRNNKCLIPTTFFEKRILPNINLTIGQWHRLRDVLIANGHMECYGGKEYSKQVTVDLGKRIRVYEFDNEYLGLVLSEKEV